MDTATANETETKSNTVTLILAWLAVGLPLAWGIEQTVKKALALFS